MNMTIDHELNMPTSGITTRIALLSMLALRPMHGYELRQVMEARHMHRWANIQYGSIYRGLQQLAREGLLAEAGEEREGNRPPRTIYRITDEGQAELKNLLRKAWAEPALAADPVDMAMRLMMLLSPEEIRDLIQQRLAALAARSTQIDQTSCDVMKKVQQLPEGMGHIIEDLFEHRRYLLDAERRWMQYVQTRLEAGAYHFPDEALEHMRRFVTRTGEAMLDHPPDTLDS
ncbi:MAG: PadR family transcriptional regulator [Anaerolineae bacterium]|nr:PadR family transcriptional regulator [Anaerolineae bacterium]